MRDSMKINSQAVEKLSKIDKKFKEFFKKKNELNDDGFELTDSTTNQQDKEETLKASSDFGHDASFNEKEIDYKMKYEEQNQGINSVNCDLQEILDLLEEVSVKSKENVANQENSKIAKLELENNELRRKVIDQHALIAKLNQLNIITSSGGGRSNEEDNTTMEDLIGRNLEMAQDKKEKLESLNIQISLDTYLKENSMRALSVDQTYDFRPSVFDQNLPQQVNSNQLEILRLKSEIKGLYLRNNSAERTSEEKEIELNQTIINMEIKNYCLLIAYEKLKNEYLILKGKNRELEEIQRGLYRERTEFLLGRNRDLETVIEVNRNEEEDRYWVLESKCKEFELKSMRLESKCEQFELKSMRLEFGCKGLERQYKDLARQYEDLERQYKDLKEINSELEKSKDYSLTKYKKCKFLLKKSYKKNKDLQEKLKRLVDNIDNSLEE